MNIEDGRHAEDLMRDKYEIPSTAARTREIFRMMEVEQYADYQDYLRRCKGAPISTVKPSVPGLRSKESSSATGGGRKGQA